MTHMKHIAIVSLFASLLAAQTPSPAKPDPSRELAKIIAVEEQERDLAKAEAMYREAIAGTTLSREAKGMACLRLVDLLFRLGRREEAKPFVAMAMELDGTAMEAFDNSSDPQPKQDPERDKALREKARERVKKALSQPQLGLEQASSSRLLWIGESAIPEIAAGLAAEQRAGLNSNRRWESQRTVEGLAAVLWQLGSEAAASHLEALWSASDFAFRSQLAAYAGQLREPRMLRLVEKWVLQEKDESVCRTLLMSNSPQGVLYQRMEPDVVIQAVRSQPVALQALLLTSAARRGESEQLATHLVELSRTLLAGSDPEGGRAAQSFLKGPSAQALPARVELLLEQLPGLENVAQEGIAGELPSAWRDSRGYLTGDVVRRLWPQLMQCARKLPPGHVGWPWLCGLIRGSLEKVDAPGVLELLEVAARFPQDGFGTFSGDWLRGRVDMGNAGKVFSLYAKLPKARPSLLEALSEAPELPADLFTPLRDRLHEKPGDGLGPWKFLRAMARTGHAGLVDEVMTAWRADPKEGSDEAAWILYRHARKDASEAVRAAMRELLDPKTPLDPQHGNRPRLLLALLSMHDTAALPLLDTSALARAKHPYATRSEKPGLTPIDYLLARDADPPHGFTEDEVVALLSAWFENGIPPALLALNCRSTLSDRVLGEVARHVLHAVAPSGADTCTERDRWLDRVLGRIRQETDCPPDLRGWIPSMLVAPVATVFLDRMNEEEVRANRAAIEALLDQEDEQVAMSAVWRLREASIPPSPERLFANRHPQLRMQVIELPGRQDLVIRLLKDQNAGARGEAAVRCGNVLDKEAVPGLLALLSDPDQYSRKTAAEALTKIRFYHEQQAHWDRVLKGLDASPANAAEKLLLQAKPDAPKAQRLLAITSLGTLGVPEALPFLIDWTADPDAEIQKAAKDAITQIHLNPRK